MSEAGHDPRSIANAIIDHALRRGRTITHLSVQKLLYFAHASYLIQNSGRPLIRSTFEAWQHGPVCRPVYDALRQNGNQPITALIRSRDLFTGIEAVVPLPTDHDVGDHVAHVMRTMGNMSAKQLVELSHAKGGAWREIWDRGQNGVSLGNRIDDKLTMERFAALRMTLRDDPATEEMDEAAPVAGD